MNGRGDSVEAQQDLVKRSKAVVNEVIVNDKAYQLRLTVQKNGREYIFYDYFLK